MISSGLSLWSIGLFVLVGLLMALGYTWLFNLLTKILAALKFHLAAFFFKRLVLPAAFISAAYSWQHVGQWLTPSLAARMGRIFDATLTFFTVVFFLSLVDGIFLVYYRYKRRPFPLPRLLRGFILTIIYIAVFFIILRTQLAVNITPFLATSALLTAIIGLAFQGVLSNVLAGLSLNLTRAFSRGDWVQIGTHEGVVEEMNWRETILLDRATNFVVLPNSLVAAEKIINFSRPDKASALILEIKVGYENKPHLVVNQLLEAAREIPHVLVHPEPQAFMAGYDHLGINYWLKFWVKDFSRKNLILGEVARQVWYKFQRQGIKIPLPFNESFKEMLSTVQPHKALGEVEATIKNNVAYLLQSDFLRYEEGEKKGELLLPAEEIMALASKARRENYTRGEVLFRQGEKGDHCFVVAKGRLRGEIIYEDKGKKYVSEFEVGEGGIVGEMSLFTGMPRTATVVVAEEAELLKIVAIDFAWLLGRNAKLAEMMAEIVSQRNQKNQDFLRKIQNLSQEDVEESCSSRSILARLRRLMALIKEQEG